MSAEILSGELLTDTLGSLQHLHHTNIAKLAATDPAGEMWAPLVHHDHAVRAERPRKWVNQNPPVWLNHTGDWHVRRCAAQLRPGARPPGLHGELAGATRVTAVSSTQASGRRHVTDVWLLDGNHLKLTTSAPPDPDGPPTCRRTPQVTFRVGSWLDPSVAAATPAPLLDALHRRPLYRHVIEAFAASIGAELADCDRDPRRALAVLADAARGHIATPTEMAASTISGYPVALLGEVASLCHSLWDLADVLSGRWCPQ